MHSLVGSSGGTDVSGMHGGGAGQSAAVRSEGGYSMTGLSVSLSLSLFLPFFLSLSLSFSLSLSRSLALSLSRSLSVSLFLALVPVCQFCVWEKLCVCSCVCA